MLMPKLKKVLTPIRTATGRSGVFVQARKGSYLKPMDLLLGNRYARGMSDPDRILWRGKVDGKMLTVKLGR